MPMIPAFCDTCSTVFSSGIFAENVSNLALSGNTAGPCPNCGGTGHIPDGVFNIIGQAIHVLNAPRRTIRELQRLAEVIEASKANEATAEEVKHEIEEAVPELSSLMSLLPTTRSELYGFLTLIATVISLILPMVQDSGGHQVQPTVQVNEVIENIYQTNSVPPAMKSNTKSTDMPSLSTEKQQPVRVEKIGRNEKCPCGSGLKFKKCHGR